MSDTSRAGTPFERRSGSTAPVGVALFGRIICAPVAHGRELEAF
jgi:hypothetical protein